MNDLGEPKVNQFLSYNRPVNTVAASKQAIEARQAIEVNFWNKRYHFSHETLTFNYNKVESAPAQKQGIKKRLSMTLSRKNLLTMYNFFVGPLLDYAEIINDKAFNEFCKSKLEAVQ